MCSISTKIAAGSTLRDRLLCCGALRDLSYGIHTTGHSGDGSQGRFLVVLRVPWMSLPQEQSLGRCAKSLDTRLQCRNATQNEALTGKLAPLRKTVCPDTGFWRTARRFTGWNQHRPLASLAGEGLASGLALQPNAESEWWPAPSPPRLRIPAHKPCLAVVIAPGDPDY